MSSHENSHKNIINDSEVSENQNQEIPKNNQEQRSIVEPSTEFGSKKLFIIWIYIAGINELNSRNNSTSVLNIPNIINNNIDNNILLDEDEEDEDESRSIRDSAIFDDEEYFSYNLILNAYFNRQIGRNINFDDLKEKINNFIDIEKNEILEEKEEIKKNIIKYKSFKESYLKQKRLKKEELKKIYSNEIDNNKELNTIENNIIQIEFSTGEIINEDKKILTKFPNSILSACINKKVSLPQRKKKYFLDRNYSDFKLVLYYLKKSKLPKFKTIFEEKNFFKEITFWKIPINPSKKLLQFDINYSLNFFSLDKSFTILTKKNDSKGIILLNKKLKATSPYFEFILSVKSKEAFNNKKFLIALIDKKIFNREHLSCSFENKSAPFIFYWDVFNNYLVKNKIKNRFELEKKCICYLNNYEIKLGIKYEQINRCIKLYKNDKELNIEIKNIEPGFTPAFELDLDDCKIQLLQNSEYQDIFYL